MPSSVRSTCSSSADRRRMSQSLNRVSMLGHLSGIDSAALPPFRTDSPMSTMQDQLRSLYGASSLESLNSFDAVVTQIARPGPDAAPPLTGPETGRHGQRRNSLSSLARSESGKSQHSTGSGNTSRARTRRDTLARQHGEQQSSPAATVVSRPPLSHPEILKPGHSRARSEAAVHMGSTERKRQSMAMKGAQSRQSLAVPDLDLPDWLTKTFKGSRFASKDPARPLPPLPSAHAGRDSMGYDSRRYSTAAVVPETRVSETAASIVRDARRRSINTRSLNADDDDLKSVYSTRSAATTSCVPRNFSRPTEKKHRRIVREQGVDFEMLSPLPSTNPTEQHSQRSFRPLSVVIPPSQSSSSTFTVRSVARSTTPPPSAVAPSPSRTTSTSSVESPVSTRGRTRTSTMSSATTVSTSRSPSPARGAYNPAHDDKSALSRVKQSSTGYQRSEHKIQQSRSVEPPTAKTPTNPRYSVIPPGTNANVASSFATPATADRDHRRASDIMTRSLPCPNPRPLATHPVEMRSGRQMPTSLSPPTPREVHHRAAGPESPPSFDNNLHRSDSLFLGPSASRTSGQQFFPAWNRPQQQAPSQAVATGGAQYQPYRKYEAMPSMPSHPHEAEPIDDRRLLPSQRRNVSPSPSLQRTAAASAQVYRGSPATVSVAEQGSARSLRKTTAIDFARMREEHDY